MALLPSERVHFHLTLNLTGRDGAMSSIRWSCPFCSPALATCVVPTAGFGALRVCPPPMGACSYSWPMGCCWPFWWPRPAPRRTRAKKWSPQAARARWHALVVREDKGRGGKMQIPQRPGKSHPSGFIPIFGGKFVSYFFGGWGQGDTTSCHAIWMWVKCARNGTLVNGNKD